MKILVKGIQRDNWGIRLTCGEDGYSSSKPCYSTLIIEKEDVIINKRSVPSYAGGTDYEYVCSFVCPVCGLNTTIERNLVPSDIFYELKNKYDLDQKTKSLKPSK